MDFFEVSRVPGRLDIVLSPKLRYIDRAGEETEHFIETNGGGIGPFGVMLIMREALSNAVLHGSRHAEDSKIRYSLRLDAEMLIMEVEDDGDGFDWKSRTAKAPHAASESGRGMAIMSTYASGFQYNEKGNQLTVFWNCQGYRGPGMNSNQAA